MPTKELFSFEQIAFKLSGGGRSNAEIMTSLERYFWRNRFPLKEVFWKPYALVAWVEEGISRDSDALEPIKSIDRRGVLGLLHDVGEEAFVQLRSGLSEDEQFCALVEAHHDEFSEKTRLRLWPSICVTQAGLRRWADEYQVTLPAQFKPRVPAKKPGPKSLDEDIAASCERLLEAGDLSLTENQKTFCVKIGIDVIEQNPELKGARGLSDSSILRHTKHLRQPGTE